MNNKEIVAYITGKLLCIFEDVVLGRVSTENQPNNSFYCSFIVNKNSIAFIKDRGYIEVRLLKNGDSSMLHEHENKFSNIKLTLENLNSIIEYLKNNKELVL